LEGESRERFEKSIIEYAHFIRGPQEDLDSTTASPEPSDDQKLAAIEAYIQKYIMTPIKLAEEELHEAALQVETCYISPDLDKIFQWQRTKWEKLQQLQEPLQYINDILGILHGEED